MLLVLNMPLVLNLPKFWIYHGSEYASGFKYTRIFNIQDSRICQGYAGFRICLNNSWICLFMSSVSEYAWIYWNMHECAYICLNVFCFIFPHFPICFSIPFLLAHLVTYLHLYRRLEVYILKEQALFFKRQNFIFSLASISFILYFRLNIFASEIWICCCLPGLQVGWGLGAVNLYTLLVFCFFLVKPCKEIT